MAVTTSGLKGYAYDFAKAYNDRMAAGAGEHPAQTYASTTANMTNYNNPFGAITDSQRAKALQGTPWGLSGESIDPYPPAPAVYTPGEAPAMMDRDTAMRRAGSSVNPVYDALRGKAETANMKYRESIPQLMAARHGMAGLRGGHRESAEYKATQNENQGIADLETQRQQTMNSTADSIQNNDHSQNMALYNLQESLKSDAYNKAYQKYHDDVLNKQRDEDTQYNLYLKQLLMEREDERNAVADSQWNQNFGLQEKESDFNRDPNSWLNQLKKAQADAEISATNRSNRGGGGSSGGLTPYQQYQIQQDQAKASEGEYWRFNSNNVADALTAIAKGEETSASVNQDLTARLRAGQINADEYNQWMYKLFPDQVGQQSSSYTGSSLQNKLLSR